MNAIRRITSKNSDSDSDIPFENPDHYPGEDLRFNWLVTTL